MSHGGFGKERETRKRGKKPFFVSSAYKSSKKKKEKSLTWTLIASIITLLDTCITQTLPFASAFCPLISWFQHTLRWKAFSAYISYLPRCFLSLHLLSLLHIYTLNIVIVSVMLPLHWFLCSLLPFVLLFLCSCCYTHPYLTFRTALRLSNLS